MLLVDTPSDPAALCPPGDTVVDFRARFEAMSEVPRPRIKRVREARFAVCARLVPAPPPPPPTEEDVADDTQVMVSAKRPCVPALAQAVASPDDLPYAWTPAVAAWEAPRPTRTKSVALALACSLMACLSVAVPVVLVRAARHAVGAPARVASVPRHAETLAAREVTVHSAALALAKSPRVVRERVGASSRPFPRPELDAHGF
jgi:hypothetical protein